MKKSKQLSASSVVVLTLFIAMGTSGCGGNRTTATGPNPTPSQSAPPSPPAPIQYDPNGFAPDGTHQTTGHKLDPRGFNSEGLFVNGSKFDDRGFDISGLQKDGSDRDSRGFDLKGKLASGELYDSHGFNAAGVHKETLKFTDAREFDAEGTFVSPLSLYFGTKRDDQGFDIDRKQANGNVRKVTLGNLIGKGAEGSVFDVGDGKVAKAYDNKSNGLRVRDQPELIAHNKLVGERVSSVVQCYGIAVDSSGSEVALFERMDTDLRSSILAGSRSRAVWRDEMVGELLEGFNQLTAKAVELDDIKSANLLVRTDEEGRTVIKFADIGGNLESAVYKNLLRRRYSTEQRNLAKLAMSLLEFRNRKVIPDKQDWDASAAAADVILVRKHFPDFSLKSSILNLEGIIDDGYNFDLLRPYWSAKQEFIVHTEEERAAAISKIGQLRRPETERAGLITDLTKANLGESIVFLSRRQYVSCSPVLNELMQTDFFKIVALATRLENNSSLSGVDGVLVKMLNGEYVDGASALADYKRVISDSL